MYRFYAVVALLISTLLVHACNDNEMGAESIIQSSTIKGHIAVLANDSLLGRKPFTLGEKKTLRYIQDQYQKIGLEPANKGSYFQDVPLVEIDSKPSDRMEVSGETGETQWEFGKDFIVASEQEIPEVTIENAPLVFAGYGIIAPEYDWNDYKGIDVKGKVVVVLVNDPGFQSEDPKLFKGDTMTYYGRWTYKYEEAARQGAAGVLIVHQTRPASYPWTVIQSSFTGAQLYLQDKNKHLDRCKMEGWISEETAQKLLSAVGLKDFRAAARQPGFKAIPLHRTLSLQINNQIQYNKSQNVAGMIKGSEKPDEVVIYSAHWDHFGIGRPVHGDSIYNGAVDNASGVASMLSIAQAFTRLSNSPKRSILFLAVTAEEQGLLGSEYYAKHPLFPLNKTVANLNMDAMGNYGNTEDLVVTGLGQNHLEEYLEKIASRDGLTIKGDLNPASGSYFRSDHFSFAKVGVPALDLHNGEIPLKHPSAWAEEKRQDYGSNKYHQPSDELDSISDFNGMVQVSKILFEIGYQLADGTDFPKWKSGSEFGAAREKMMK